MRRIDFSINRVFAMKKTKEETVFFHRVLGCSCRTAKKTSQSSSVHSSLDGKSKEAV